MYNSQCYPGEDLPTKVITNTESVYSEDTENTPFEKEQHEQEWDYMGFCQSSTETEEFWKY